MHKSIISCKHQYFTVFLPFLVFFTIIDYLHGHPSSIDLFFLLLFFILFYFFFQASTSDLSIQKENNETTFTIGESRTISNANDTQAKQVAPNPRRGRFSTETPLKLERRLQIHREQRRRRREQREHRLAQRRQRGQQETEEQRNRRLEYQRHYDRFTLWKTHIC